VMEDNKVCSKCKLCFPYSEFGKNKSRKDGLDSRCKKCVNEYQREWKEKNPESRKRSWTKHNKKVKDSGISKKRYQDNKEEIIRKSRKYYSEHREEVSLKSKLRYENNREHCYKKSREWITSHREQARAHQAAYRERHRLEIRQKQSDRRKRLGRAMDNERRRGTDRSKEKLSRRSKENKRVFDFTEQDWEDVVVAFGGKCAYCQRNSKLTRDHFNPVTMLGGDTVPGNIVPACLSCNSSKGNRVTFLWVEKKFGVNRFYEILDVLIDIKNNYDIKNRQISAAEATKAELKEIFG
jgi:hypothetical protein